MTASNFQPINDPEQNTPSNPYANLDNILIDKTEGIQSQFD